MNSGVIFLNRPGITLAAGHKDDWVLLVRGQQIDHAVLQAIGGVNALRYLVLDAHQLLGHVRHALVLLGDAGGNARHVLIGLAHLAVEQPVLPRQRAEALAQGRGVLPVRAQQLLLERAQDRRPSEAGHTLGLDRNSQTRTGSQHPGPGMGILFVYALQFTANDTSSIHLGFNTDIRS